MEQIKAFLKEFLNTRHSKYEIMSSSENEDSEGKVMHKIKFRCQRNYYNEQLLKTISIYIQPFENHLIIRMVPEENQLSVDKKSINEINRSQCLGQFIDYYNSDKIKSLCLKYCFFYKSINEAFLKDYFNRCIEILIEQFEQLLESFAELREQRLNQKLERICSMCNSYHANCDCSVDLELEERDIDVINDLKQFSEHSFFDFDPNNYDSLSSRYLYSDRNLLVKKFSTNSNIQNFKENFAKLLKDMSDKNLYCTKLPINMLMLLDNGEVILSPILKSSSEFKKWFSIKENVDEKEKEEYFSRMNRSLSILRMDAEHKYSFLNDYICTSKFENKNIISDDLFIADGGNSKIYKNIVNNKKVAIKYPMLRTSDSIQECKGRVIMEYSNLKKFNNKNIVVSRGYTKYNRRICIVLEYLEGNTLSSGIESNKIFNIMKDVANALVDIHEKGYIHHDIKPSNIMVCDNKAKIIDFGSMVRINDLQTLEFTKKYADPLQMLNRSPGFPADVWSFAIVFIEAVLGFYPFQGIIEKESTIESIYNEIYKNERRPDFSILSGRISQQIIDMLKQCLSSSPNSRPTMRDILSTLHQESS